MKAAEGGDLALHLTEWTDYRVIDPSALTKIVTQCKVIDARCILQDARLWESAGWSVRFLGKPP